MLTLSGVCLYTDDAPRLAAYYEILLQETPVIEGSHYGFRESQLAVYDPGNVGVSGDRNTALLYYVKDLAAEYARLQAALPGLRVASPPERRAWGAFSCWLLDPDGNTVSLIEK